MRDFRFVWTQQQERPPARLRCLFSCDGGTSPPDCRNSEGLKRGPQLHDRHTTSGVLFKRMFHATARPAKTLILTPAACLGHSPSTLKRPTVDIAHQGDTGPLRISSRDTNNFALSQIRNFNAVGHFVLNASLGCDETSCRRQQKIIGGNHDQKAIRTERIIG